MGKKKFDIRDYVHNNDFELKSEARGSKPFKGYNDIRKTNIDSADIKVVNGKFSLSESMEATQPMGNEVKKHLLELISTYNSFQSEMKRQSDIGEIAETLGGVVEAAKTLTLNEADDWFDKVTIKRNMKELEKLDKDFNKVASESRALDERMSALYEDMGNILSRYYEISDIDRKAMNKRLGKK